MKFRHCIAPLLIATSLSASADMLGVWVGANGWSYDIDGSIRTNNNAINDIDIRRDLGYDSENLAMVYAIIEQPIPLIPDVKISRTSIDSSASGALSSNISFGGKSFSLSEQVTSSFKLDQTDLTLYWHVLDNVANLDIGLTAKYLDTTLRIQGATTGAASTTASAWIPMAYAGVGIDLPFSGLSVSADGSYIGYGGSSFYDYTVRVTYDTPWVVGIDAGYRRINLTLDDIDGNFADLTFKGPYAGLYLHF